MHFRRRQGGLPAKRRSLIQTMGRAARNAEGMVIMYADTVTDSMEGAITETERRRSIQQKYNEENHIVPQTVTKRISDILDISTHSADEKKPAKKLTRAERERLIEQLTREMKAAARLLEFEHAAFLRDKIKKLREEE